MTTLTDAAGDFSQQHLSLMHGWLPLAIQGVAIAVIVIAIGWRDSRWRRVWLPAAAAFGIIVTGGTYWFVTVEGLAGDPAPKLLWLWTTVAGATVVVLVAGWRSARWWRRGAAVVAVPMALSCAALALNLWVGYFPTVQTAWNQLTSGPLPNQTDQATVVAMQQAHQVPSKGTVVPITIDSTASGFKHRGELVYLPPAWFASVPAPKLPTLMMIGGEFNTPADWLRTGDAIKTADDFAAAHGGNAPVMVFVDSGGAFNNDTECVNGSRGNAADHLTKDVPAFMEATYGVSASPSNWGIVGWSMGGTCAVNLTVMHPELFSAFEDIAGDLAPNSGNKQQTIDRLFGGDAAKYAAFDPLTVIERHGTYTGIAGWFDISGAPQVTDGPTIVAVGSGGAQAGGHTAAPRAVDRSNAAQALCSTGASNGIACAVVSQPGKHQWPFAAHAFSVALPWLAGRLGTPGVLSTPLPPNAPAPPTAQAAGNNVPRR